MFAPFGNPIPSGNSGGDPYGYTGEWYEGYIGLLYLRARWYAVETGTFLSRDPVESEPPYLYVRGNPVNWTDPSGMDPPITDFFHSCMSADYFEAPGYAEGVAESGSLGFNVAFVNGEEVVYDFARMERGVFQYSDMPLADPNLVPYTPGFTTAAYDYSTMVYHVDLEKFDSHRNLEREYSGPFTSLSFGAGSPIKLSKLLPAAFADKFGAVSVGMVKSYSPFVEGVGTYRTNGVGFSPIPIVGASFSKVDYNLKPGTVLRRYGAKGYIDRPEINQIKDDIMSGVDSPWSQPWGIGWLWRYTAAEKVEDVWEKHQFYFKYRFWVTNG